MTPQKPKNPTAAAPRESQAVWAIIIAIIWIDAVWALALDIRVIANPIVLTVVGAMLCANLFYMSIRPDRQIAAFTSSAAQLTAFISASVLLSYLVAATSKFPLIDQYLVSADAALGFNWLSFSAWVHSHEIVDLLLTVAYISLMPQVAVLVFLLPAIGRVERLREFVWLTVIALLMAIAFSWFAPAEGAWAYYKVTPYLTDAFYPHDFSAIRSGEMPEIVMAKVKGIVQFPSFHTTAALTLIYAARGVPYLLPASFLLNVLMLVSTLTCGGHHLMDVLAGVIVLPLAIFIVRSWRTTRRPVSDRNRTSRTASQPLA